MKTKTDLTAQQLRELLDYDPETGIFTWRVRRGGLASAGSIAGSLCTDGYLQIKINGRPYNAHRLAWVYAYNTWPADQLDHINGIRDDNRLANLREATNSQNQQNQSIRRDNKSGHPGVYWDKRARKWRAQIMVDGKRVNLGSFDDHAAAIVARASGKARHHEFQPRDRGSKLQPPAEVFAASPSPD